MTQDEIIEMAKQAGFHEHDFPFKKFKFEAFAKLVAAKEREACLKICEEQARTNYWEGADVCVQKILLRGEA
jgi:hypothetical protein